MKTTQADVIKIAAVVTASPRWVGALLASEGLTIPDDWMAWWVVTSAIAAGAMAIVEGWSFSYTFTAWRGLHGKPANKLLALTLLSAAIFVIVLAPYIGSSVQGVPTKELLGKGYLFWIWNVSIATSTISIVASVGYAQKQVKPKTTKSVKEQIPAWKLDNTCWCDWQPVSEKNIEYRVIAHSRKHVNEMKSEKYQTAIDAWEGMKRKYPLAFANGNEPVTIAEIAQIREG